MRRYFSAILILFVFFCLQYGKIATYLYCKWQTSIVQSQPDCGCENHLTSMFDHHDDDSKEGLAKVNLNEKLNEFSPKSIIVLLQVFSLYENTFSEYDSPLSKSYIEAPFHPPIA